jgi:DNA-binding NarL/FixJ family response regulator
MPAEISNDRVRVLVADSASMSCQLLAEALVRTSQFDATPTHTSEQATRMLTDFPFDVLLISPHFPEHKAGFRMVRDVRKTHPDLNIVALLDFSDRDMVVEAFRAGVRGVFCRSHSFPTLCKCILRVHQGQVWANSEEVQHLLEALVEPLPIENHLPGSRPLSKREEEIARLVAEGFSNRQISERLDLSEHTIKNYLFRVFEKLGVSTRVELTLYTLKRGDVVRSRLHSVKPPSKAAPEVLGPEN